MTLALCIKNEGTKALACCQADDCASCVADEGWTIFPDVMFVIPREQVGDTNALINNGLLVEIAKDVAKNCLLLIFLLFTSYFQNFNKMVYAQQSTFFIDIDLLYLNYLILYPFSFHF